MWHYSSKETITTLCKKAAHPTRIGFMSAIPISKQIPLMSSTLALLRENLAPIKPKKAGKSITFYLPGTPNKLLSG